MQGRTLGRATRALALVVALITTVGCGSSGSGNGGSGGTSGGGQDGGAGTGGATGADGGGMCSTCFVHGRWQIDNLSPCFTSTGAADGGTATLTAVTSTSVSGGVSQCPTDSTMKPTDPWSTDTLTTDCPGHYHLCITLKAGDAKAPAAGDCTVVQDCADDDYAVANQPQMWAKLPGWLADAANLSCAEKFRDSGGYAQLTATGTANNCGAVTKTLALITFCPISCAPGVTSAACAMCMAGGTGAF